MSIAATETISVAVIYGMRAIGWFFKWVCQRTLPTEAAGDGVREKVEPIVFFYQFTDDNILVIYLNFIIDLCRP